MEIADKAVVVTGSASGIGYAIADACAQRGARIILADVETGALEQARVRLAQSGTEVIAIRTDVRYPEQLEALRDEADRTFGGADILCNNAGVLPPAATVWETPIADMHWTLDVNLLGIVHGLRAFVPGMIARGAPSYVVNTASMAALGTSPYFAAYGMGKAAVVSLSGSLRDELQAVGAPVGVSVLLPEMVQTRLAFAERNRDEGGEQIVEDPAADVFQAGLDPAVLGARVVAAIEAERFWILPPADDPFMQAAKEWMTGIEDSAG